MIEAASFAPTRPRTSAADREPARARRPAHVDQDERPGIRFESGEHSNGRVFYEEKGEPAHERDFQTAAIALVAFKPRDQPRRARS